MPGQSRAAPCRPRRSRDVVFVDGVRTPFGKAGPKGMYAETRADDLVIRCIRELLRRNPELPPERVDEVAIAATTQIGDQGLTIGRTAALLAGLPKTRARLRHRPDVRRRDDRGHHDRRRHRLRRLRRRDRRRRRAHGPPPDGRGRRPQPADRRREAGRPVRAGHGLDRGEPARPVPARSPRSAPTRSRWPARTSYAKAVRRTARSQPDLVPVATRTRRAGLGPGHASTSRRGPAPRSRTSPR